MLLLTTTINVGRFNLGAGNKMMSKKYWANIRNMHLWKLENLGPGICLTRRVRFRTRIQSLPTLAQELRALVITWLSLVFHAHVFVWSRRLQNLALIVSKIIRMKLGRGPLGFI